MDRRWGSDVAAPPFTGTYADANNYADQFHNWFSAPESVYPIWQNRKSVSYVAHHKNCPTAPIDSAVGVPGDLQNCVTYTLPTYFPKPKEGTGYAGLRLLDTIQSQYFNFYGFTYATIPCGPKSSLIWIPETNFAMDDVISRNFLETKLQSPLQQGEDYTLEFYTVKWPRSGYTTGDMGAYVSQDTFKYFDYRQQTIVPQVMAQDSVFNDASNYQQWTHVKGSFMAQGGEQFLTLGNFTNYNLGGTFKQVYMTYTDTAWGSAYYNLRLPEDYFFDAVYLYKSSDSLFSVNLPADTVLCAGDSLEIFANHTNTFKIQATKTFRWSTGSTDSSITIGSPGTYWLEVAYNNRWRQYDTIVVDYYPSYQSGLPNDTLICEGSSLALQVPAQPGVSHQWSNGSTANYTTINLAGNYTLQSFTPCDTLTDSIALSYFPKETLRLPADTILCNQQPITLTANLIAGANYLWSNGSTGPVATYVQGGTATLTVNTRCDTLTATTKIEENDCQDEEVYIPNSFTPNGDGLNDTWQIANLPPLNTLHIANRWGQILFEASPYQNNWNGTDKHNNLVPNGMYVYRLTYQWRNREVRAYGWINVMRP